MAKVNLTREVTRVFKKQRDIALKAEVMALNRAGRGVLTDVYRKIREDYNIKLKDLKKVSKMNKANKNRRYVSIIFKDVPLALIKFNARQGKKGVSATERKGRRKLYKSSFIAVMPSGHKGVFLRKNKSRLPIRELYGPTPAKLFGSSVGQRYAKESFVKRFVKEFQKALRYLKNK